MGKIISLVNQKGGVGKTTTSINLSSALGYYEKKVLLIDFDPQGNTSTGVGVDKSAVKNSIYDLLIGNAEVDEVIAPTNFKNLDIIPATMNLAGVDIELPSKYTREKINRILKEHLGKIKEDYDYIIIDCPPSLGVLTTNALTASDSVIIPVQCEFYSLEGIMQLLNTIMLSRKKLNPNLEIEGVLLTMFDSRTNLSIEVGEEIRDYFKESVYNTMIPRAVRLAEAPSHKKPIIEYDPLSKGSEAYLNLAKEVIERNGK